MSIFMPILCCLSNCCFVVVKFEIRCSSPGFFFSFKIVLVIWGTSNFYMHFRISMSISTNKPSGNLIGAVKSIDQYGKYCHLSNKMKIVLVTQLCLTLQPYGL